MRTLVAAKAGGSGLATRPPIPTSPAALEAHLERVVRSWIGLPAGGSIPVPTLPSHLVRLLMRTEEREVCHRDVWGGWESAFSENYRLGRGWIPEVDLWVEEQRARLAASVALEPRWPSGHRFAMCLTHDVDMVTRQESPAQAARAIRAAFAAFRPGEDRGAKRLQRGARSIARSAYFGVHWRPDTADTLARCVEIERRLDVRSSYFFTVQPRKPTPYDCTYQPDDRCRWFGKVTTVRDIMRQIAGAGCDIGLHGSYWSARDAGVLAGERDALESAVGQGVITTRQHYLHYDVNLTPGAQHAAGLRVDTTLGFNRNVGFRAGTSLPFIAFDYDVGRPVDVLELPLIVQEGALIRPNALELNETLARAVLEQLGEAILSTGGLFTILFHPHSLTEPIYERLYRFAVQWGLDRNAWIASAAEIGAWWRERERRLERPGLPI